MSDDQSDLQIITEMLEDYDLTPDDTIADLIEAINESDAEETE
jgi:hypothetical protein